jgi:hypothetical protein
MSNTRALTRIVLSLALSSSVVGAQSAGTDASARIREVLPTDVASRVLARIADARAKELPAKAIENRALKFAAKGVAAKDIEKSVEDHVLRLSAARDHLQSARGMKPGDDEVEAAAELLRKGVEGASVSALAKEAPSGRSLAVPLYVVASLIDRGMSSDSALYRVGARLASKGTDMDIQRLASAGRARNAGDVDGEVTASFSDGAMIPVAASADKRPATGTTTETPKGGSTSPRGASPKPVLPPAVRPAKGAQKATTPRTTPKQPSGTSPTTPRKP